MDFAGPKKDKRAGVSLQIKTQKCSWNYTCPITGMPNAFTVCEMTQRSIRRSKGGSHAESKGGDGDETQNEVPVGGKVIIKTLKNGEKRMCIELPERQQRETILRRYGILPKRNAKQEEKSAKAAEEKDEYDEEFEQHDEYEEAMAEDKTCDYAHWTNDHRREGAQFLADLSRDTKYELQLKKLMSEGCPPRGPVLSILDPTVNAPNYEVSKAFDSVELIPGISTAAAKCCHPFVLHQNFDPCTQLELHWDAGMKGDLVSFYVIEFAGPVGGAVSSSKYKVRCMPCVSPRR